MANDWKVGLQHWSMIGMSLIKGVKTLSTMDLPMCKLCAMWQTMGSKQTGVPYLEGQIGFPALSWACVTAPLVMRRCSVTLGHVMSQQEWWVVQCKCCFSMFLSSTTQVEWSRQQLNTQTTHLRPFRRHGWFAMGHRSPSRSPWAIGWFDPSKSGWMVTSMSNRYGYGSMARGAPPTIGLYWESLLKWWWLGVPYFDPCPYIYIYWTWLTPLLKARTCFFFLSNVCYAMQCYAMLCYVVICDMLCMHVYYVTLRNAMLCMHVCMLCYAMLCYGMLSYAMLCYVMYGMVWFGMVW